MAQKPPAKVPPAKAAPAEDVKPEVEQPKAFIIPTDLLIETARLVGAIPAAQVGTILLRLQHLRPLVEESTEA